MPLEALLALAAVRSVGAILSNLTAPAPAPVVTFPKGAPKPYGAFVDGGKRKDGAFAAQLDGLAGGAGGPLALHFAPGATQSLAERGVRLGPEQIRKLLGAAEEAAGRGGETALVLMDGLAYLVDLRERQVIDVTDKYGLANQQYARIDSIIDTDATNA